MSNVKISGNVSGTGTLTIAAPNTNTDRTLTLPDESGTLLTSASPVIAQAGVPAFSAYQSSSQSISAVTWTKVTLQSESFDTASCFDNSTNYRFTPTTSGYYQLNASVASTNGGVVTFVGVYKNGTEIFRGPPSTNGSFGGVPSTSSDVIYMNGSTDYVEMYVYSSASMSLSAYSSITRFSGVLVRAA